jgi:hypothetical protein
MQLNFLSKNEKILIYAIDSKMFFCNVVIEDSGLGMDETTKARTFLKEYILLSKRGTM